MEPQFWHERWEFNEIGFHQLQVSPLLAEYWPSVCPEGCGQVFVPLCGKSVDMMWLRHRGHSILGIEISPIAIDAFFEEQALAFTTRSAGNFQFFESEGIQLLCGDFFGLFPEHVEKVQAVYDRAALIALPHALQRRYAEHLQDLLPHRPPVLLITFEYDPLEMDGPPFSTTEGRVRELFGHAYQIETLSEKEKLEEYPGLRHRGLTWLAEKAYLLH